jgi:hypothetical protein
MVAVLRLQQTAGNRAVGRLLARRGRLLGRFAEREHKLIGDTAWRRRGDATGPQFELAPGVKLSYGDAVALGDFFESFDRLKQIAGTPGKSAGTQGELRYVLWVDIWGNPEADKMDRWYDAGAKFHREQLNAYFDSRNIGHFPNPVEGDLGRPRRELDVRKDTGGGPLGGGATYRTWHEAALLKSFAAGRSGGSLDEAYLTDGFACHFLTDAFSASHITTPRLSIKQYWDAKVPNFDKKLIRWLADEIDHGDWAWYERVGAHVPFLGGPGQSIHAEVVEKLLHKLGGFGFGDLVSLVVHDVAGDKGVEATVGGKPIRLVGDGALLDDNGLTREGRPTFEAATEAVGVSIGEIQDAYMAASARGSDLGSFEAGITKADGLYAAERLIPVPTGDAAVRWRYATVEDFLDDAQMGAALVRWGMIRGKAFAAGLKDFNPKARGVVSRVLVDPLRSGDEDQVRGVLRTIIDYRL